MLAIFKRELRSYFLTPSAYIFMGTFLLLAGVLFTIQNLFTMSREYALFLGNLIVIFILVIPLLTMRIFSEERKNKTDQLLMTSPVSPLEIAAAKFLAPLAVFALTLLVTFLYPLLLSFHGTLDVPKIIGTYTGFFLLGAVFIALGVLISSLTENMAGAAIMTLCAILLTWVADPLLAIVPTSEISGAFFLTVIVLLASYRLFRTAGKKWHAFAVALGAGIPLWVLFLVKGELFYNLIARTGGWLSVTSRFSWFPMGVLPLADLLYYLSAVFLLLFLTGRVLERRRWSEEGSGQALYSGATLVILLAALLFVNLITQSLNWRLDLTKDDLFTLSDDSVEVLEALESEVTIYGLYKSENDSLQIKGILDQYDKYKGINVEIIDPDRNPALLSSFTEEGELLEQGSLIVTAGGFSRIIKAADLYNIQYGQSGPQVLGLKAEQKLTAAILYVKTGRIPVVYEITGHNEYSFLGTEMERHILDSNYRFDSFNITTQSGIPEDADVLILTGPQRDLTAYEAEKLEAWLNDGGKLLVSHSYVNVAMPNLSALLLSWDLEVVNGLVMERETDRLLPEFGDNPFYFAPYMGDDPISTFIAKNQLDPFFFGSAALRRRENGKSNLVYTPLFSTSGRSNVRLDMESSSFAPIDGDLNGPFHVASAVFPQNGDTRIVLSGSPAAFTPIGGVGVFPGNIQFLIASLSWLDNSASSLAIPSKPLYSIPLRITTARALLYGIFLAGLIPLMISVTALVINRKRRRL